jgi:hypothetical protein
MTTYDRVYPLALPRRSNGCPRGLDGGASDPRLAPFLDTVCPRRRRMRGGEL